MQEVYVFVDDSGVLHPNSKYRYFVYGGLVIVGKDNVEIAKRKYRKVNMNIRKTLIRTGKLTDENMELKASRLEFKHRRALYNVLRKEESFCVSVDIPALEDYVTQSKKSIFRYKDYALKLVIKKKIVKMVSEGKLNPNDDLKLFISIDNQNMAMNGVYNLEEMILEELKYGIVNFDYSHPQKVIFDKDVYVDVKFCDSKVNYLIQAADIFANKMLNCHCHSGKGLKNIPNHLEVRLP